MEGSMDTNGGTERKSSEAEQKTAESMEPKKGTAGEGQERAEKTIKRTKKEQRTVKRKEKKNKKIRKENGENRGNGFWNSRKFQNAVCMIGLILMTLSAVGAWLFCFSMDIDKELSAYGIGSVLEETMMTSGYTDSWLFEDALLEEANRLAETAYARAFFETDGKFDENKTIDLAYAVMRRNGEKATGITYRIGDLLQWESRNIQTIWLIQPQLDAVLNRKKEDPAALFSWDEMNQILMSAYDSGKMGLYPQKKCIWIEFAFPTDGDSLYLHAGDLNTLAVYTEYLEDLIRYVHVMYDRYTRAAEEPGNIGMALVSPSVGLLCCSFEDYAGIREGGFSEISEALYDYVSEKEYGVVHHYGSGTILGGNKDISLYEETLCRAIGLYEGERLYLVLDAELPENDLLRRIGNWYENIKTMAMGMIAVFAVGLALFLTTFVRRTMLEGRDEAPKPRLIDRWFTIALPAVIGLLIVSAVLPLREILSQLAIGYRSYYNAGNTIGISMSRGGIFLVSALSVFVIAAVVSYCYFELVNRLKKHTLYQKSLLRFVLGLLGKALRQFFRMLKKLLACVNGKVKWVLGYVLFLIVNLIGVLIAFEESAAVPIVLLAVADLIIGAWVIAYFREQDVLRKHMEATVQGSRREPLAADRFHGMNKKTAELINDMDSGISRAVEKSMKDERMRTELIANVSHDIRTPLTSIINYVDLLKKEPIESENAQNYLAVLDEKSARLKQLTEDLVEASRITSGNVSVTEVRMSASELVEQIAAEYEEKFKQKELTLVLKVPEDGEDDFFIGDSRYVWRVLSNLFSNLCKYAMPHTRVYFGMYRTPSPTFCMELKNISEYPLNISPEELTERFVRGDSSRGTEGNGLGLSIAQSLMNAMHGSLKIMIDGDLFKVLLNFPVPPSIF